MEVPMAERNVTPMQFPLKVSMVLGILGAVVAVAFLATSFYVVDQTEEAVVLTFGKYASTQGPGLHFKMPLGIQKNFNVRTRVVQTEQFGFRTEKAGVVTQYDSRKYPEESTMLTGDLNIVDVEWILQYKIKDPKAWLFNTIDRHKTIRDISQSTINMLVGDRKILDVIGPERTVIEQEAANIMNVTLSSYGLGVDIIAVRLQNIVPPVGVQEAFEDVNKAIQDMNRLINEGKEAYNQQIPKARGQADGVVQVARGYATERVNRANGDVARFNSVYEEYRKAPEVTRNRLYYEMVESIFANETSVELIDDKLTNFIPLKNLGAAAPGVKP